MEPYAYPAEELNEMAEKLNRLSTAESRHGDSIPLLDGRSYDAYDPRLRPPSGGYQLPPTPESQWSPTDEVFRVPNYELGQRSAAALPLQRPVSRSKSSLFRKDSHTSERRPSRGSSAGFSLYPAARPPPPKPLPALPLTTKSTRRISSQCSFDNSSIASGETSRYSDSTRGTSGLERVPTNGTPTSPASNAHFVTIPSVPEEYRQHQASQSAPSRTASSVTVVPWKSLTHQEKAPKDPSVYFFDISTTSATLASKHGNNIIKIWSVGSGEVQSQIKISCYTTAQPRSREYFVRSHAILSEPSNMMAIAAGFGDSLEIWDWGKKKKIQSMDKADRWAAVRSNVMEAGWCPLVTYRGDNDTIELWEATYSKKPFKKSRVIELAKAGLPVLPKYPELAFSATGPLLITASGPRPPRLGHPPPERETLLIAWEIHNGAEMTTPYKVVAPWQHAELDTALPSGLATYGSVAVSIWIPASYRAIPVPVARGGVGFNLAPVSVPFRYVLVWDFSASSTKTFRIPNAMSCVSPDCRFIAYCDSRGVDSGARGCLAVLDAMTGKQLWCWPDPDATAADVDMMAGFSQLANLSKVTEMCFSADGGFLFIGDSEGGTGVFEVREGGKGISMRPA
ncbi:hypothetical protein B0T21DRAFT_387872 [Apiosordaria backusii]|uniref:WD40 repeat-like protein n=1 Tax=Apiosordaria backusii TaxID=314023 RepID=A0AA39ZUT2_9PEZI|nr:hypothetical protein B0T21DRAFT_387872 [Apiosordaria backusii]